MLSNTRISIKLIGVLIVASVLIAPITLVSPLSVGDPLGNPIPLEEVLDSQYHWALELSEEVADEVDQKIIQNPCGKASPFVVRQWLEPGHHVGLSVPEFHLYIAPQGATFENLNVHGGLFGVGALQIGGNVLVAESGIIATADRPIPGEIEISGTWVIDGTIVAGNGVRPHGEGMATGVFPEPREFTGMSGNNGAGIHLIADSSASKASKACISTGEGSPGLPPCLPPLMAKPSSVVVTGGTGGNGGSFKMTIAPAAGGGSYSAWDAYFKDSDSNATFHLGNGGNGADAMFHAVGPGEPSAFGGHGGHSGWIITSGFETTFEIVEPYVANGPKGGDAGAAMLFDGTRIDPRSDGWWNGAWSIVENTGDETSPVPLPLGNPGDPTDLELSAVPSMARVVGINPPCNQTAVTNLGKSLDTLEQAMENLGPLFGPSPASSSNPGDDLEEALWWTVWVLQQVTDQSWLGDDGKENEQQKFCDTSSAGPPGQSNTNISPPSVPSSWYDGEGNQRMFLPDAVSGGSGTKGGDGTDGTYASSTGGKGGDGLFYGGRGGDATATNTCKGGVGGHGGAGSQGGNAIGQVYDFCETYDVTLTSSTLDYDATSITVGVASTVITEVSALWSQAMDKIRKDKGPDYVTTLADSKGAFDDATVEFGISVANGIETSFQRTHTTAYTSGTSTSYTYRVKSCQSSTLVYANGGAGGAGAAGGGGGDGGPAFADGGQGGRGFVRSGDGGNATATGAAGGIGGNGGIPGQGGEGCTPGAAGDTGIGGPGGDGGGAYPAGGPPGDVYDPSVPLDGVQYHLATVAPLRQGFSGSSTGTSGADGSDGEDTIGKSGEDGECERRDAVEAYPGLTLKNGHASP